MAGVEDLHDIWSWNAVVPERVDLCVHDLIGETTRRQPDAQAICSWDGELTYSQLDELSTRLANHLISLGVEPGVIVPLCFEKSMWTPVAMLGVMKAGGASVALDSTLPEARLVSIVRQTGSQQILCSSSNYELASRLGTSVPVLVDGGSLSPQGPVRLLDSQQTFPSLVKASDLLFVVFTSGSTGAPKGAQNTHSNFASAMYHQRALLRIDNNSRIFDFASYAFDAAWLNFLHTLTAGACLCIPSEYDRKNDIGGSMRRLRVNHANLTPSVAEILDPASMPKLEVIVLGGERINKERLSDGIADCIINEYGPAECTVVVAGTDLALWKNNDQNIGRGVGSTTWVVDQDNHDSLVPIGTIGELLIEGPLVGKGYLNDPSKTAAAFIKDPPWLLGGGPGVPGRRGRLYKTGDLVCYKKDGTLSFVGRKDSQVKIRGQRVELTEVEHHVWQLLTAQEDEEARVVAEIVTPYDSNSPMLVVFLSLPKLANLQKDGMAERILLMTARWNAVLEKQLPACMVPSAYVPVNSIPMTATGKTDRRRLREMGASMKIGSLMGHQARSYAPPSTETEKSLHDLWNMLLKSDRIGLDDNFFLLGGDSVLAMRLVALAHERGMALSVDEMFKHPKLGRMASAVRESKGPIDVAPFSLLPTGDIIDLRRQAAEQCSVSEDRIEDIYPSTALQRRWIVGVEQSTSRPKDYQGQFVYSLPSSINLDKFRTVWNAAIDRYTILRTRLIQTTIGILQVVVKETKRWESTSSLHDYLQKDKLDGMKFGNRLLRLAIAEPEESQERYFVMSAQHAIYDGFSLSQLFKELGEAYDEGFLGAVQLQMNQYIKVLMDGDQAAAINFFASALTGAKTGAILDCLHPDRQIVFNHTHKDITFDLPKIKSSEITLSTMIEVAIGLVFGRNSGIADIIIRSMRSGRTGPVLHIDTLIAPVTMSVPVRIHFDASQSVLDLLQATQAFQKAVTEHSHMDYWDLMKSSVLESVLQYNIPVNIIPRSFEEVHHGLGLKLVDSFMTYAGKFAMQVVIDKNKLTVVLSSDDEYISLDWAMKQLNDIKLVLLQILTVYQEQSQLSVKEVLDSCEDLSN